VFDEMWKGWGDNTATATWRPPMDVSETETEIVATMDLPGLSREDIKVNVDDGVLSVSGEKRHESEDHGKHLRRAERFSGEFSRSIALPSAVDTGKITAEYKDGVLTVRLPKAESARPKQIEVKAA
jgi:HSP20 family protein